MKKESPAQGGGKEAQSGKGEQKAPLHPAATEDKVKELTDLLQRLQAEFENASKRMEKEKKEFIAYADAAFARELLPFIDSLEKAGDDEGVRLLRKQFQNILVGHGFREIGALGQKFDPHLHEVMMNAEDKQKADGVVVEEFQKGYTMNGLVLRPAKVKVNKLS